ncbi:Uncharacterised protein [Mycobacteroides abscessus]|nr:Uncharacterised protein [Mycobacteroides abscessus]
MKTTWSTAVLRRVAPSPSPAVSRRTSASEWNGTSSAPATPYCAHHRARSPLGSGRSV